MADTRLLTEAELELMRVLWEIDGGTVRQVMAQLPPGRDPAYTTVSTILRILVDKGFARAERTGRAHVYRPAVPRPQYEARTLRHLVGRLFGGDPAALVRRLVAAEQLSPEELASLAERVQERSTDGEEGSS